MKNEILDVEHLILDWSGTISDDIMAVFAATNDVLARWDKDPLSFEKFRQEFDLPIIDFYKKFFPNPDFEEFCIYFKQRWPINAAKYPVKPIQGVGDHLDAIQQTNIPCHIISVHHDVVKEVEDYFPDKNYFSKIFISSHDKEAALRQFAEQNSINPSKILYVGDMKGDVRASKAAGARSAAVLTGYHTREQLEKECPDAILENLGELPALLKRR